MIKRVLLDMDGVIANFHTTAVLMHAKRAASELQIHCAEDLEDRFPRGTSDIAAALHLSQTEFWIPMDNYEFWMSVPAYEGARDFVETLRRHVPVALCTRPSLSTDSIKAKVDWVHRHIGTGLPIYLCYDGGKAVFAREDQLLVDDYDKNTEAYTMAGGPSYLIPRPWTVDSEDYEYAKFVSFGRVDYDCITQTIMNKIERSR